MNKLNEIRMVGSPYAKRVATRAGDFRVIREPDGRDGEGMVGRVRLWNTKFTKRRENREKRTSFYFAVFAAAIYAAFRVFRAPKVFAAAIYAAFRVFRAPKISHIPTH
jgi:hypothetical protein